MCLESNQNCLSPLVQAIEFATACHEGQTRKFSNEPYIVHPLRVLELVQMSGLSENLQIAAALHDTVEDSSATFTEIKVRFGKEVSLYVKALTKSPELPKAEQELQNLIAINNCPPAQSIKLADIIANVEQLHIEAQTPEGMEFAVRYLNKKQQSLPYLQQGHPKLYTMAVQELQRQTRLLKQLQSE